MNKTYTLQHNCICTSDNKLTEGNEYILKEGGKVQRIVLEKVLETGDWLKLLCYFPDQSKTTELVHKHVDFVYFSMWRIYDPEPGYKANHDNKEAELDKEMTMDEYLKENPPKITKAGFLQELTEEQIKQAVDHFKKIYDCQGWGEREQNMTYLAWLRGEGRLMLSDYFMFHEIGDVEFNCHDYEITIESDVVSGVCIHLTEGFYDLDTLYKNVLKR